MLFKIHGLDARGKKREISIDASDEEEARQRAHEMGIVTMEIMPLAPRSPSARPGGRTGTAGSPQTSSGFPALRALSGWYRVAAVLSGTAAVIMVLIGLTLFSTNGAAASAVIGCAIVFGIVSVISLLALSEGILLMLSVEKTLREIRERISSPSVDVGKQAEPGAATGRPSD